MSDNYYNIRGSGPSTSTSGPSGEMPLPSSSMPAPMSVVAIVGLVLAFTLCLWPAGLILSIIGLVQTKNGAKRGFAIAVIGLIINGLLALLTVIGVATGPSEVDPASITRDNAHEMADQLEREVDEDTNR